MSEQKLTDLIPVKKYEANLMGESPETGYHFDVMKVSDIENFLQKITQPQNLTKLIKAMTFGQKLDFEDLLK